MTIQIWSDFEDAAGEDSPTSGDYTHSTNDYPTSTYFWDTPQSGGTIPTFTTGDSVDWNTGEQLYDMTSHFSTNASMDVSALGLSMGDYRCLLCFELDTTTIDAADIFVTEDHPEANHGVNIFGRTVSTILGFAIDNDYDDGNSKIRIQIDDGGASLSADQAYALEFFMDMSVTTDAKAQARLWQIGDSPGSWYTGSTGGADTFGESTDDATSCDFDTFRLSDAGGGGNSHLRVARFVWSDDPDEDLSGAADVIGYPAFGAGSDVFNAFRPFTFFGPFGGAFG